MGGGGDVIASVVQVMIPWMRMHRQNLTDKWHDIQRIRFLSAESLDSDNM